MNPPSKPNPNEEEIDDEAHYKLQENLEDFNFQSTLKQDSEISPANFSTGFPRREEDLHSGPLNEEPPAMMSYGFANAYDRLSDRITRPEAASSTEGAFNPFSRPTTLPTESEPSTDRTIAPLFTYLNRQPNTEPQPPTDQLEKITFPTRTQSDFCKIITESYQINPLRILSATFVFPTGYQVVVNDDSVAHLPRGLVIRVGFAEMYSTSEESHQRMSELRSRLGIATPIVAPGRERYSALKLIIYL